MMQIEVRNTPCYIILTLYLNGMKIEKESQWYKMHVERSNSPVRWGLTHCPNVGDSKKISIPCGNMIYTEK